MESYHGLIEKRGTKDNYTKAYSFPATGNWDGNDGAWSSFMIRVGSPPQLFRVLPSTSGQETWIPRPDQCSNGQGWCGNARGVEPFNGIPNASPLSGSPNEKLTTSIDAGSTCTANRSPQCITCISINGKCTNGPCTGRFCCGDPAGDCNSQACNGVNGICTGTYTGCPCQGVDYNAGTNAPASVGILNVAAASGFQSNQSASWSDLGIHGVLMETSLNASTNGQYGTDTVGLGIDAAHGPTVHENVVAGVLAEPFYIGTLGLKASGSSNVTNGTPSLMSQLKQQGSIPSLSYGYTAGAFYRATPIVGSLTLGGYDLSRSLHTNASFPLAGNDTSSLEIGIQSITALNPLNQLTNNSTISLLSSPITALIDTTLPFIYLPLPACAAFESAFDLTWNDDKSLYLVNDTTHQALLNSNPSITFSLGSQSANNSINITLPYASFDLQAASPIFANGTNYFPLRRATSPDQYTLGRTFLQESYLFVEYEKSRFSISQAQFPSNPAPNIVTVDYLHHPKPASSSHHSLSRGAIAGIVIGVSALIALLSALAFFYIRRHRRSQPPLHHQNSTSSRSTNPAKQSWPSSPSASNPSAQAFPSPDHNPDANTVISPTTPGTATTVVNSPYSPHQQNVVMGELEDPKSPFPMREIQKPVPLSVGRSRQELQGSDTAKELPPTPGKEDRARHIFELASEGYSGGSKGRRSGGGGGGGASIRSGTSVRSGAGSGGGGGIGKAVGKRKV